MNDDKISNNDNNDDNNNKNDSDDNTIRLLDISLLNHLDIFYCYSGYLRGSHNITEEHRNTSCYHYIASNKYIYIHTCFGDGGLMGLMPHN